MPDQFNSYATELDSPAVSAVEITPADGADLAWTSRALYVGGQGDVKVTTCGGDTVTFVGLVGLLPVRVKRVFATGTTATGIVALR